MRAVPEKHIINFFGLIKLKSLKVKVLHLVLVFF